MNSYTWPRVNSVTEERDSTLTFYRPSSEPRLDSRRIFACWESADTEGRHVRHIGGKIVSRIALRCIRLLSFPWQPHCAGSKHAGPVLKRVRLPVEFHSRVASFASIICGWNQNFVIRGEKRLVLVRIFNFVPIISLFISVNRTYMYVIIFLTFVLLFEFYSNSETFCFSYELKFMEFVYRAKAVYLG